MKLNIINNLLLEIEFKAVDTNNDDLKKMYNVVGFSYRQPNTDEMNRIWDEFIKINKNKETSDDVSSTYSVKSALGKELENIGREFSKAYFGNFGIILVNKLESISYKHNFIKNKFPDDIITGIIQKIKRVVDNNKSVEDLDKFIYKTNSEMDEIVTIIPIDKELKNGTVRFFINAQKKLISSLKDDTEMEIKDTVLEQYKVNNELNIEKFNNIFNNKILSDLIENKPKYEFHIYLNNAFKRIFGKKYKANVFSDNDNKKYYFIVDVDKMIETKDIVVVSNYILILFYNENGKVNKLKLIKIDEKRFDEMLLSYLKKSKWGKNISTENEENIKKENKYIKRFENILTERLGK